MDRPNNSNTWIDVGYDLFAREGIDALQIERLARVAGLNKSGFYHHFGDLDGFCAALLTKHEKVALDYVTELKIVKTIEPEYLNLLVKYKVPVMFQMHMTRVRNNPDFQKMVELVDRAQDAVLNSVWCNYLDVNEHSDLAMRYFHIVRDTFYARVTFQNYSYDLLQSVLGEARAVLNDLGQQRNFA